MPETSRSCSRRRFLQMTSAATVALPLIISPRSLRSAMQGAPSDRVGIGFIGAGRRAGQLTALPKDAQIVAVADCFLPAAEKMAQRFKCRAIHDYRHMLELPEVDAVVIATPDHWHTLPAVHACQAGKDVYLEKPLTLTIREGRQLVNAVRKHGRILQTGSQQRSIPRNRVGCEMVRNGAIGKLHTIIASNYESPWECALPEQPIPDGLDWNTWCGQTQPVPYHIDIQTPRANPGWISFRPWSGGEMTGWGAHGFDQMQWALDACQSGPIEVWVEDGSFQPPTYTQPGSIQAGNKACSRPLIRMRYANEVLVKLEDDAPRGGAHFVGDRGTITINRNELSSDPPEIVIEATRDMKFAGGDNLDDHMADWVSCIKSRELPVADVEIGHRSATVCHLGNIARWTGRRLQWDPENEQFVGDEEANQLVARQQRSGYEIPDSV